MKLMLIMGSVAGTIITIGIIAHMNAAPVVAP